MENEAIDQLLNLLDHAALDGDIAPDARRVCSDAASRIRAVRGRLAPLERLLAMREAQEIDPTASAGAACRFAERVNLRREVAELCDRLTSYVWEGTSTLRDWVRP